MDNFGFCVSEEEGREAPGVLARLYQARKTIP